MKTVLFLCTGNFYRSRFAEEVFNHLAPKACPGWQAVSRGIAVDLGIHNVGPVHPAAVRALAEAAIPFELATARLPLRLTVSDLEAANHIVALKAAEHIPLLQERFAGWFDERNRSRVEFWHVHDTDQATPEAALPEIMVQVKELFSRLHGGDAGVT